MARPVGSPTKTRRVVVARQRVWNAIRVFKQFTSAELEATAEVGAANVKKYLRALVRAGYLRVVRPKRNGRTGGHAGYRLARDTGIHAPMVRKGAAGVYDPNQDRLYPFPEPGHERG